MPPKRTAAQRAKDSRENRKKQDPEEYKRRENERKRKKYVPIAKRPKKQQKEQRKTWNKNQKRCRDTRKNPAENPDPPSTPVQHSREVLNICDGRKSDGKKRKLKDRASAYRKLNELNATVINIKRSAEKYKKRHQRLKIKYEKLTTKSPMKRTLNAEQLAKKDPKKFRRNLLCLNATMSALNQKYKSSKNHQVKQTIADILRNNLVKKYKAITSLKNRVECRSSGVTERKVSVKKEHDLVRKFYHRDDVSRLTADKKRTLTRDKVKQQVRLLNDSLSILFRKFKTENPDVKMSLARFCRLRPFYIIRPTLKDRDTCLCIKHDNLQLLMSALVGKGILTNGKTDFYSKQLVCDLDTKKCMYGDCVECKSKTLDPLPPEVFEKNIQYYQWEKLELAVETKDENVSVKPKRITKKVEYEKVAYDVYSMLEKQLKPRFTRHIYNIKQQYHAIRELRKSLKNNEAMFHIDFSENYTLKYSGEIQAMHFGSNVRQASLHTGVCYIGQDDILPFCSISENTQHDPAGIWAHLLPVLNNLAPSTTIKTLHFVSDGPTTQYRNKTNFAMTKMIPFGMGYQTVVWNLLEAGHGKGAADGIGATIKRTADALVSTGTDIPSAAVLYRNLIPKTKVRLFYIEEENFERMNMEVSKVESDLKPIPGTMQIHQLFYNDADPDIIRHRQLSCYCSWSSDDQICKCYDLKNEAFVVKKQQNGIKDKNNNTVDLVKTDTDKTLELSDDMVGKFCIVRVVDKAYPGVIRNIDIDSGDVEVSCMDRSGKGKNRFFWPLFDDLSWYNIDDVLEIIEAPAMVNNGRQYAITDEIYGKLHASSMF